jgi:hypothetical protein
MLTRAYPLIHRKRKRPAARPRPRTPAALVLVAADFDAGAVPAPTLTLSFDRAIDIAEVEPSQVSVDDGPSSGSIWVGGAGTPTLVDPQTVRVPMSEFSASASPATMLTATAASGIRAADDGGTWPGVTDLELPLP